MEITRKNWMQYIYNLGKADEKAAELISDYLYDHEIGSDEGFNAFVDFFYSVVTKYAEGSSEMAAQAYEALAEAQGATIKSAMPAETPSYGECKKAIRGTMLDSDQAKSLGQAAGRLVRRTGVDTTLNNALRDGAEWAWVPSGDTCAFCMMLASNGWQRASKKAIKNGHASHIHANCDCTYAIRFDGVSTVEGYDPDYYKALYDNAEGVKWQDKLNSMRRDKYAANPEKYREQKRIAYRRKNMNTLESPSKVLNEKLGEAYEYKRINENLISTPLTELGEWRDNVVNVDYGNISSEVQQAFTETLVKLSDEYSTYLTKVTMMDDLESFASTAMATTRNDYSVGTAQIRISGVKCKDYDGLIAKIEAHRQGRYCPRIEAGKEAEYLMTHEFAHTLLNFKQPLKNSENFVGLDYQRIKTIRKEITEIYEEYADEVARLEKAYKDAELDLIMMKRTDRETILELKEAYDTTLISKYSLTNVDEFMAEAFADYKLNKTPTSVSEKVGGILDKYFKKP